MKLSKWLLLAFALFPGLALAQAYNVFQPGCALAGTWNAQTVNFANSGCFSGNVPAANQTSIASPSFLANDTGSTGPAGATNPLAASTMMSAVLAVDVVSNSNITLSGLQTIDGVLLSAGQFVLVRGQTTQSQNGIYVVSSSAWSRAANFPAGYTIGQNCEIVIIVRLGTTDAGSQWYIPTASAITIGTTAFLPTVLSTGASNVKQGTVVLGGAAGSAMQLVSGPTNNFDCASFDTNVSSTAARIEDFGDANNDNGLCAVENPATGHLMLSNTNGNFGTPHSSVGTINPNSTDNWGSIGSLSAATSVTVTFQGSFTNAPGCTVNDSAGTAVGISAISATAVTFTMSALTGSLYYTCFGTN